MKAKNNDVNYDIIVQYVEAGNDINSIKDIKLYLKPQDFTAYYVINDDYTGKVGLF